MAVERVIPSAVGGAGGRIIATPFQFYSDGSDNVRVEVWNSASNVTIAVDGRWQQARASVDAFAQRIPVTNTRARNVFDFALGEGYVLNLVVYAAGGTPRIGQTFVRVSLIRGLGGATIVLGTLLQGYVTGVQGLGWPGSPIESSIAGGGLVRFIQGTNPPAGSEIFEQVPTGARWELVQLGAQLVTSAVAGNRRPAITFQSLPVNLVSNPNPGVLGPGGSIAFAWGQGMPLDTSFSTLAIWGGLTTGVQLFAGDSIGINTQFLDPGDNWGPPAYYVREWLEVDS